METLKKAKQITDFTDTGGRINKIPFDMFRRTRDVLSLAVCFVRHHQPKKTPFL
jgi:hypothetical protein